MTKHNHVKNLEEPGPWASFRLTIYKTLVCISTLQRFHAFVVIAVIVVI